LNAQSDIKRGAKRPEKLLRTLRNEQLTGFTSNTHRAPLNLLCSVH